MEIVIAKTVENEVGFFFCFVVFVLPESRLCTGWPRPTECLVGMSVRNRAL